MVKTKDEIMEISIHALVKRATNVTVQIPDDGIHFNPRPRKEGDSKFKRETHIP